MEPISKQSSSSSRALWLGILGSLGFTALIWISGERLASIPHLPDSGAAWYYWRLPAPNFWSRATAWGFYFLHQISFWGLIYYAQTRVRQYSRGLHRVNYAALGMNAIFILLHLVQTQIWYDGLAQDVSIFTSQGSVILMLVWILLMENRRRGLFFGKPAPLGKRVVSFARRYHGYVFAWATVYTFWYHPTENTSGHLIGFFYMFLLLLQGSLFLTRIHVNRWWTFTQEALVMIHGTLVAVMQGNDLWPMFAFGFAGIFLLTQMHGLRLGRGLRSAFIALYIGAALWIYLPRGLARLEEVIRIPLIEYLAVFILAGILAAGIGLHALFGRGRGEQDSKPQPLNRGS